MKTSNPKKTRQFKCTQCNLAFFENRILQNHLKCHDPKYSNELTCHICERGFTEKHDRDRHVQNVHFKERNFSCEHCLKDLVTRSALTAHIRQQHSDNAHLHLTRYHCELCDTVSFGIIERRNHLKIVHKTNVYKCEICKISLSSKQSLQKHARIHIHTSERLFTCDICQKSFRYAENLKKHNKIHFRVKSFKCQTCGKRLVNRKGLRDHIQNLHEKDQKMFKCVFCPASYVNKTELDDHIRSHTQEKPYQCQHCSNCYQGDQGLRCHIRSAHSTERKFKCEVCEKAFPNRTNLNGHKLIHTTSKTEKKHKCSHCNKAFVRRGSWRVHQNIHLDERNKCQKWNCIFCAKICDSNSHLHKHLLGHVRETPYMCGICKKECSSRAQVQLHTATHTGEQAYKCKICEISYSYPKSLQRHVKSLHQGMKPFECVFSEKKFGSKAELWSHYRYHSREKSHFCPRCNAELSCASSAKNHSRTKNCKL